MSGSLCPICGVNLEDQDKPWAYLVAWPQCLLPGDLPADYELCKQCKQKLGAVSG